MKEKKEMAKDYETANRGGNKRADKRARSGRRGGGAASYDLRGIAWPALAALVVAFAENGGALRIGFTRDGGALALGCYVGDDYATEYVRPNEDFLAAAIEIAEAWLPENGQAYHQALNEFQRQTAR